jgi:chemotaxis protein MotB
MAYEVKDRRRRVRIEEHENHERWLLTYSDMITLLLALFIVLFSISSVNISKYLTLQQSLRSAFSGSILPGGRSILQSGSQSTTKNDPSNSQIPPIVPLTPTIPKPIDQGSGAAAAVTQTQISSLEKEVQQANAEQDDFKALQRRLNAYAKAHGWQHQVQATIQRRGLVVTVLTDKLLFASGEDTLRTAGDPLLDEIATLINLDTAKHPVVVEGYTDNVPIHTSQFPSNWELSTGRATTVLQYLLTRGVPGIRLSAAGYAAHFPEAPNTTATGRALNRRVEVVFERKYPPPGS